MGLSLTVHHHAATVATTVAEVLANSTAIGVAGVERRDGSFENNPPRDSAVNQGDAIILIMRTDNTGDSFHKHPSGKTILLADDHRALRLLFSRKLAAAGHDVVQASTGEDALAMARVSTPDLVVLDVNMPHRDGYEVCAALRQSKQFTEVPIILYSGDDTGDFVQRGREAGADICIRKTSKSSELLASIEEVFSQRHAGGSETSGAVVLVSPPRGSAEASSVDQLSGIDQRFDDAGIDDPGIDDPGIDDPGIDDPGIDDPGIDDPGFDDPGFDIDVAMANADGDRRLLGELVTVMLEETPRLMERISLAITQLDHDSLHRAAHSLKSSLAILGAREASDAAAKLESAAGDCDWDNFDELHGELQTRIATLMRALEKHVASEARDGKQPV
jgi:CheY-like chemotaxis protein